MMLEKVKTFSYREIYWQISFIFVLVLLTSFWLYFGELEGVAEKSLFYFIVQGFTGIVFFVLPPVYINIYWLIPRYLVLKKYFVYFLLALCFAALWGAFIGIAEPWTDENWFGDKPQQKDPVGGFAMVTLMLITSGFLNIAYRWFIQSTRIQQLENERLTMELSVLRNQINPHFFFNTLNNLYALSLEHSDKAPQVILKLSEMMRYTIYDCQEPRVSLENEVRYIENYLSLEKIRQDGDATVTFDHEISSADISIAPMVLVVFIENAFKHGFGTISSGGFIHINLKADQENIYFSVTNNFQGITQTDQHGLGLENVKRRLTLLYPGLHTLEIDDSLGQFKVDLTLKHD